MKRKLAIALLLPLGLAGISISGFQDSESQNPKVAGGVHGSVYARLDLENADDSTIALPDIAVVVRNTDTGRVTQVVKTHVDGRYEVERLAAGKYQLCWKAKGWVSGCNDDPIILPDDTEEDVKSLDPIGLVPNFEPDAEGTGRGVVMGRVRLSDGSACEYSNPLFGVDQSALVSALDDRGNVVSGPVRANSAGEYVLAGVPQKDIRVRATCAAGSVEALATAAFGTVVPLDLTVNNSPPQFVALIAEIDGQAMKSVLPGATVDLAAEAQGSNADHLQYRWATAPGFGSIVSTGGNHARWTAPSDSAPDQIHVLISHDRGGFAQGSIVMGVGVEEAGVAPASDIPYAQAVVTNGITNEPPGQEFIPPYEKYSPQNNAPFPSAFLTRRKNLPANPPTSGPGSAAERYYQLVIDPGYPASCAGATPPARCTLGGWWTANGWRTDGTSNDEADIVFLNNNDIGYIIDMHCRPNTIKAADFGKKDVSCYVTNYSEPANQEVPGPPFAFPPPTGHGHTQDRFRQRRESQCGHQQGQSS
jgi:hypothetical protein